MLWSRPLHWYATLWPSNRRIFIVLRNIHLCWKIRRKYLKNPALMRDPHFPFASSYIVHVIGLLYELFFWLTFSFPFGVIVLFHCFLSDHFNVDMKWCRARVIVLSKSDWSVQCVNWTFNGLPVWYYILGSSQWVNETMRTALYS